MAATPESKVKTDCRRYLKALGAYEFCPVQSGIGKRTLDWLGCIGGKFVGIEFKRPGALPTKLQTAIIKEINDAGGIAFYADSLERCKTYVEDHVLGLYCPPQSQVRVLRLRD